MYISLHYEKRLIYSFYHNFCVLCKQMYLYTTWKLSVQSFKQNTTSHLYSCNRTNKIQYKGNQPLWSRPPLSFFHVITEYLCASLQPFYKIQFESGCPNFQQFTNAKYAKGDAYRFYNNNFAFPLSRNQTNLYNHELLVSCMQWFFFSFSSPFSVAYLKCE